MLDFKSEKFSGFVISTVDIKNIDVNNMQECQQNNDSIELQNN